MKAQKMVEMALELMNVLGIEQGRLRLEWISSAEGPKFAEVAREFTAQIHIFPKKGAPWERMSDTTLSQGNPRILTCTVENSNRFSEKNRQKKERNIPFHTSSQFSIALYTPALSVTEFRNPAGMDSVSLPVSQK